MTALTAPLGTLGLFSVVFMMFMLADLSRRLGSVTKMKPYYRVFYVAMGLLSIATVARVLRSSVVLSPDVGPPILHNPVFYLIAYHLPLVIAVTLGVGVTWRYWGWLFRESQS